MRQGHAESKRLARERVNEGKFGGVEGVAGSGADVGVGRLAWRMGVEFFAAERMADFGEVYADLVGAAGFEAAFDDGVVAEMFHGADVGNGSPRLVQLPGAG